MVLRCKASTSEASVAYGSIVLIFYAKICSRQELQNSLSHLYEAAYHPQVLLFLKQNLTQEALQGAINCNEMYKINIYK